MIHKKSRVIRVGDISTVHSMAASRGLGRAGKGYSYDYVRYVLKGKRSNSQIIALHDELVALRTPKRTRR